MQVSTGVKTSGKNHVSKPVKKAVTPPFKKEQKTGKKEREFNQGENQVVNNQIGFEEYEDVVEVWGKQENQRGELTKQPLVKTKRNKDRQWGPQEPTKLGEGKENVLKLVSSRKATLAGEEKIPATKKKGTPANREGGGENRE